MEKKFTKIEISIIKTQAQNIAKFQAKKDNLDAKINKIKEAFEAKLKQKIAGIEAEKDATQALINSMEEPIMKLTGGYKTVDLVNCETIHTGKINATTGKEVTKTHYVLKYPETVIPVNAAEGIEDVATDNAASNDSDTLSPVSELNTAEEVVENIDKAEESIKDTDEAEEVLDDAPANEVEDDFGTNDGNNPFGEWE